MHSRILLYFMCFCSYLVSCSAFFLLKEKLFCKKVCPLYCSKKEKKLHHDHDIWSSWQPPPINHYHYHKHEYYWHEDGPYFYEDPEFHPDFEHHPKYSPWMKWTSPTTTTSTTTMAPTTTEEPSGICLICRKKCYPWWAWDKDLWWD